MFRRLSGVHTAAVAAAGIALMIVPALTGTLPAGAMAAPSMPAASAHNTTRPARIGVSKTTTAPCGMVKQPPISLPPVSVAPIFTPGPPAAPGLCPLQASEYDIVVGWYARSDNANSFIVYRLDAQGDPQDVYKIAAYDEAGGTEP
jgi:hypothetical protein